MRLAAIAALTLAAVIFSSPFPAHAQAPEVISMSPKEGDVLAEPPTVLSGTPTPGPASGLLAEVRYGLQLCFARPVDIRDKDKGGDFGFSVTPPSGSGLGLRIVFQPDGLGVEVFSGLAPEPLEGEWAFEWRVRDPDTLEPATGTVKFLVSPDGNPAPEEPRPPCTGEGAPPAPGATPTPVPGGPTGGEEGDDQDILFLALITTGAVLGAAFLGLILYRLRQRLGFWMHRPPPGDGGQGGEHR